MNLSGEAVKALAAYFKIAPPNIIVIYDDVDLAFGSIRIRPGGGSGGHKGVESVIEQLGTNDFPRIRLGIGRPEHADVVKYVLNQFSRAEKEGLRQTVETVKDAVDVTVKDGIEKAMNRFNK